MARRPDEQAEIIAVTAKLLAAASAGDYTSYSQLSDPSLTAIEPETQGTVIEGLAFHKCVFDSIAHANKGKPPGPPSLNSIGRPHVRMLGPNHAVICYLRVTQNGLNFSAAQETRVWQREGAGQWKNVHFHRSPMAKL